MDSYITDIIKAGDNASDLIHEICVLTHKFRPEVQPIDSSVGGLTVIKAPSDKKIAVHSCGGCTEIGDNREYAKSLVDLLSEQARRLNAKPVAMTNTLDMSDISMVVVRDAAEGLFSGAEENHVAIVNGEIAGLGSRVSVPYNISGTMMSFIPDSHESGVFEKDGMHYIVFEHDDMPIFMNSDGVGTKIEIYERTHIHSVRDFFAMVADDAIKKAGTIKAISGVLEKSNNDVPQEYLRLEGELLAHKMGFEFAMQPEDMHGRVSGYGEAPYNLGGTCVSLIDVEVLKRLVPQPEEYLVAIRDPKNPTFRSNGITKLRETLEKMFGPEWHTEVLPEKMYGDDDMLTVGELAVAPSTVFYPVFKELIKQGLVSSVYHMSGGAHNGKLARPLAKYGLGAELNDIFEPSLFMAEVVKHSGMPPKEAYEVWNMGNEGYVATLEPKEVLEMLKKHGLEGRTAGSITEGKLLEITLPNDELITYRNQ